MGNSSSVTVIPKAKDPVNFNCGTVYHSKEELVNAANEHCNLIRKACRVYRSQPNCLHIVCVHQCMAMRRTDKKNAAARNSFIPITKDDKFQKEEYPSLCSGVIKAHPLRMKENSMSRKIQQSNIYTCEAVYIKESCAHSCEGPPPSISGSRRVPHNYAHMARLGSNAFLANPSAKSKWIGNVIEDKMQVPIDTFSYPEHHRMKRSADELRWGDRTHHFGCTIHLLETMKEFDPDSRIFLKVFPDMVNPNFFVNPTEYRKTLRGKNTIPEPEHVFALRFGAIGVTMGSSVRRHAAASNGDLLMRNVRPMDATFLKSSSRGTSCDIIQLMAAGEITLETITADAENESQNAWSFALETDKTSLGDRRTNPQSVFIGDRLKGQDTTLQRWYPHIGKEDCVFHLKENMKEPKNGHATFEELALFDLLVHSATMPEALYNRQHFINLARVPVGNYVSKSIFSGNSKLERFCDAAIMNRKQNREREGIRSAQGSESFHFATITERLQPIPFFIAEVYFKQYTVLQRMLDKYEGYAQKSMRLPPSIQLQIDADTGLSQNYSILQTGVLQADVSRIHGGTDPNVHHINLEAVPFTCNRECLERNGCICSFAIIYMKKCGFDPIDFIPEKYTVTGGIRFLQYSLKTITTLSYERRYADLKWSIPHIIPPHVRVPKGRPPHTRKTKGHKMKKFLAKRYEKKTQECIERGEPIPESDIQHLCQPSRCYNCGGDHYRKSCRAPNDGMGNALSVKEQNAFLSGGFLIIEIRNVGETILPKDMEEFSIMRENSKHSTTSFNTADVLSGSEDDYEAYSDDDDLPNDSDYELKPQVVEQVIFQDDTILQDHNAIQLVGNKTSRFKNAGSDTSEEANTNVGGESDGSQFQGDNALLCFDVEEPNAEPFIHGQNDDVFYSKKELFTFLPKCDYCQALNGKKICNPVAQMEINGLSKYESFQNPRIWFDVGTVTSFQVTCYHDAHNQQVSLFTHMGDPYHNPNGYFADESDACVAEVNFINSFNPPKPPQINMTKGYTRHIGVVFGGSHFAVLDFVLNSRIIIVHDGLRHCWKRQIREIIKYDLSIFGGSLDIYTYSPPALRRPHSPKAMLDPVRKWISDNEAKTCGNWLVLHSLDFNNIKDAFNVMCESFPNTEAASSKGDPGHLIFSKLAYRPEVIQRDGGFVCGALACIAFENLINLSDAEDCNDRRLTPLSVNSLPGDNKKSILFRKSVLDKHMLWLHEMKEKGELNVKSN